MEKSKKGSISFKKKLLVGGIVFLLLVLIIASLFGKKGLIETFQAQQRKEALLQEIDRLSEEKSKIEREIEELERNPKAVEKEAREKLLLMDPDEIVIIKK